MVDVVVAIPSFRRPEGLEKLLTALASLVTTAKVTVLVADNDAERHEAVDLCLRCRDTYRWPLDAIVVPERGIAAVRNALVAKALETPTTDFIAMLDDDEWPVAHWLEDLLRVQSTTGADAVQGTIRRVFEVKPKDWVAQCGSFSDVTRPTGPVANLVGAGNLLVSGAILRKMRAAWFDVSLGLSGGEDVDFFLRLKEQGARFAWAQDAVACELVPASRSNLRWALKRAYSVGNSEMRVFLKHRPSFPARLREYVRIAAALLLYPVVLVMLASLPRFSVRFLRKIYRAAGKVAALGGRSTSEYAVVHGR